MAGRAICPVRRRCSGPVRRCRNQPPASNDQVTLGRAAGPVGSATALGWVGAGDFAQHPMRDRQRWPLTAVDSRLVSARRRNARRTEPKSPNPYCINEIPLKAQPPGWTLMLRQAPTGVITAGIDKADALRRSTDHVWFVAIIHNQMQRRSLVTGERLVALGTMAYIVRAQWPPGSTSPALHRLRRSRLHDHSPTRATRMRSSINTSVVPAPSSVTPSSSIAEGHPAMASSHPRVPVRGNVGQTYCNGAWSAWSMVT